MRASFRFCGYDCCMPVTLEISDWKPAPFDLPGETVFAVGDVHGCAGHLAALQNCFAIQTTPADRRRRLVYLGDMINRGPDNVGTLKLWAENEKTRRVDRIDRMIGNHEIIMLLALRGETHADKAEAMWLNEGMGGSKTLDEMRSVCRAPLARPTLELARQAFGENVMRLLLGQRSHLRLGNTVFVHGGLDGHADQTEFLSHPWTEFTDARWAWITKGFLDWKQGFGGTLVVHGHTPPDKHFPHTHMPDPHLFKEDRLGLDGGSARTGTVTAAEIETGRYRIIKAVGAI
jgi:serine/threonine protein phosphatase 1